MKQCLTITFFIEMKDGFLKNTIQKNANKYSLEGTAQLINPDRVRINICGKKEDVDSFVDWLHQQTAKTRIDEIEMEPLYYVKDFRGVFRVIE